MRHSSKNMISRLFALASVASLCITSAYAAAPGITGPTFNLVASEAYITQPDGASIHSWGYGCASTSTPTFLPDATKMPGANCPTMQTPGPTLIVTEGQLVTVTLTNNLPAAAGNTSILFPGMNVSGAGSTGVLTMEAAHGATVTYTFTATKPGTHSYFSGTQGDLQVEMGLYGALIVLPSTSANSATCASSAASSAMRTAQSTDRGSGTPTDFRLSSTGAVFDNANACYDREYLFQFSEIDPRIHQVAQEQVAKTPTCTNAAGCLVIDTEPYHAVYFMVNGRSMPDDMDPNYFAAYPHQPYNGNPHMHPGEMTLVRIIGQGRMQHPFHEHANHVRVVARDGNPLLTGKGNLAGPLLFTTTTTPGQTIDALFQWSAKNLNWDVHAHTSDTSIAGTQEGGGGALCTPDANGYHSNPLDPNFYEWCADHKKPLESKPFGTVGAGGPITLPDANITALGPWYSGSVYFGPDAAARSVGPTPIPPFGTIANDPGSEAGYAYMWHSHNEREITTNNIFPGGMMMMMLVDPWIYLIDESK